MDQQQGPGLARQEQVRTAARVLAVVLLVTGAVMLVRGLSAFASEMDNPSFDDGPGSVLTAAAGGFCLVFGLAAASVGWMRAHASYVAGETMPVVKDSATYLSDGRGVAGVGRTEEAAAATGPYCRQCGTRNDAEARFCDSCGQSLA
ncbi:DUF7577 domain-containing protein [Nocardioides zeicaulis]|uniref:Zinc-ribbon domain-containing protein n=1 Tax=Nocardioides zeicaulis TaxID=1776857 RepID=A0ABV6DZP9_9ACTN